MVGQTQDLLAALDTRVRRLEELLGAPPEACEVACIFQWIRDSKHILDNMQATLQGLQKSMEDLPSFVESCIISCQEGTQNLADVVEAKMDGKDEQGVVNFPSAIADADRLVDYRVVGSVESSGEARDSNKGKDSEHTGKDWKSSKKNRDGKDPKTSESSSQSVGGGSKTRGCFICDGDHRMRDCPKREKLNALVVESEDDEEDTIRMNPLQMVVAIRGEIDELVDMFMDYGKAIEIDADQKVQCADAEVVADLEGVSSPIAKESGLVCGVGAGEAELKDDEWPSLQASYRKSPCVDSKASTSSTTRAS